MIIVTVRQLTVTGLSLDRAMRLNDVRIDDIVFVSVPALAVPDNIQGIRQVGPIPTPNSSF